ncbi:MAG: hypothetical protein CR967_02670 [Proteobacteria bacterium]|nr:MAG: hypothetical protein CR967_02670 [Pseudomonadota bacterium]
MENINQQNLAQNPYISQNVPTGVPKPSILGGFDNGEFIKGALVGVAIGYLLSNEKAQKTLMKTIAKGTQMLQMGIEEAKERFEDVKAEMEQA